MGRANADRLIASAVKEEGLEFGGETIPLAPENSPRLAEAVQALQRGAGQAEEPARPRRGTRDLAGIHKRLEELVADLHSLAQGEQYEAARELAERGRLEFTRVFLGLD
jgi:hypothetical protein